MGEEFTADVRFDVPIRFRDLDPMGHVNNAVYASYLEQARALLYEEQLGIDLSTADTVLASLEIDYRAPIELDDDVTVGVSIGDLGRSSIPMDYEIHTAETLAATGHTVQVVIDRETGDAVPVPESWRTAFDRET
ncbi:MAG: thioesterase family protein [Natronomonas sp.]